MDAFCCILLVTGDRFSLIWSKSVVFTSPRRSTPASGLDLLAWKARKNNSWGCSLQEYGQQEQPSLPQTPFLLSIPNRPSEKRFAHRRKRGYIKVNALKVQQFNSLKLLNKQVKKTLADVLLLTIRLTISDNLRQSPTISDDHPRRAPADHRRVFVLSPGFSHNAKLRWRRMCESVNPPDRPFLGCIFPRVIWSRRKYLVT